MVHRRVPSGSTDVPFGGGTIVEERFGRDADRLAPLPASVAKIIADAAGAPTARELASGPMARAMFESTAATWRPERRSPRHKVIGFTAAAVIGMVGSTTGLAAASLLPPPAAHVVNGVLGHLHISVGPSNPPRKAASPGAANPGPNQSPTATPTQNDASTRAHRSACPNRTSSNAPAHRLHGTGTCLPAPETSGRGAASASSSGPASAGGAGHNPKGIGSPGVGPGTGRTAGSGTQGSQGTTGGSGTSGSAPGSPGGGPGGSGQGGSRGGNGAIGGGRGHHHGRHHHNGPGDAATTTTTSPPLPTTIPPGTTTSRPGKGG